MGYTTTFLGSFAFSRTLTDAEHAFLTSFTLNRRMRLNVDLLQEEFKGKHGNIFSPGNPYGEEGAYFVKELPYGHPAIADHNEPPTGQPSLWCQWKAYPTSLEWDGGEKFYSYVEWLEYLIEHFFAPWGVQLNGAVQWEGEDPTDIGVISVRNNRVMVHYEEGEDDEDESEEDEEAV